MKNTITNARSVCIAVVIVNEIRETGRWEEKQNVHTRYNLLYYPVLFPSYPSPSAVSSLKLFAVRSQCSCCCLSCRSQCRPRPDAEAVVTRKTFRCMQLLTECMATITESNLQLYCSNTIGALRHVTVSLALLSRGGCRRSQGF